MCGRFVMSRSMEEYVQELDPQGDLFAKVDRTPIKRYNIAPSTDVPVIHVEPDGLHISRYTGAGSARLPGPSPRSSSLSMPGSKPSRADVSINRFSLSIEH